MGTSAIGSSPSLAAQRVFGALRLLPRFKMGFWILMNRFATPSQNGAEILTNQKSVRGICSILLPGSNQLFRCTEKAFLIGTLIVCGCPPRLNVVNLSFTGRANYKFSAKCFGESLRPAI